ncbi:hypothetical protein KPL37_06985 [Clostridium frigoris]|uniref:Uncharacterized protein n=1 Tax=Clostridium frigoris TaxID=205327 RepID=A0ABS6BRD7_9CLOT|nr:hypothetical protein [Clostridium frigoris]MBU3159499.1 hypothetical protein [Clostridium frigoris]
MSKTKNENSKSIDEIYIYINLIEGYLKDLENRLSVLEENERCDNYDK